MAKRVLIISTTFVLAATRKYLLMPLQTEQGHQEMRLKLFPSEISFACQKLGHCVIKDDANEITEKLLDAQVVVWATPIYYYEMCGQMKTMIDRANSLYPRDYQFRDVYLLSVAAEDEDYTDEGAVKGLQGWIDCFEKARFAGKLFAGGFTEPKTIEGSEKLKEAYEMGKAIQ